jgi:hypothetical protein
LQESPPGIAIPISLLLDADAIAGDVVVVITIDIEEVELMSMSMVTVRGILLTLLFVRFQISRRKLSKTPLSF